MLHKMNYLHKFYVHDNIQKNTTVNVLYLACTIFGVFQIFCYLVWIWFGGWFVSTSSNLYKLHVHLAVYLI